MDENLCIQCHDDERMSFEESKTVVLSSPRSFLSCLFCNRHNLLSNDQSRLIEKAVGQKLDSIQGMFYVRPHPTDEREAADAANAAEEDGEEGMFVWNRWGFEPINEINEMFPENMMLGHYIVNLDGVKRNAIHTAFEDAGLCVNWDGTDEKCIEIVDPLKAIKTFVRRYSAIKIAAFVKSLPFFERAMQVVWKPGGSAMGESMKDAFSVLP
tara:strand:+ start:87 stop:722 length:636 start_codon:yes stop_codon:yes gene_type:complete